MSGNIIELLCNSVETTTGDSAQLKNYLLSCLEYGSFYGQDKTEAVIKVINKSLNSPFEKEKGLVILQNFLSHISVEAFSTNAISWMVSCNKIVSQKEGINNALALKVLSKLIKLSVKFPEVNKEAAKQIVPKFLSDHIRRKSAPQVSVELLECIQSCMREYPGPSGEFRLDIVKLLLGSAEARSGVVLAASKCVPLVAGVGGGGKQGVSHKTAWQRQQLALVRLLHTLLNRLYEHVDCQMEETTATVEDVQLDLEIINDRNILTKSQRLATQFASVALFLQAMLLEEFPVSKAVAPDAILDVVAHCQKPTLATLSTSREALAVTAVLPTVQVAGLRLLESLVLCLGRNLVPQGGLVCYLCSQVVHWTYQQHHDWPYAMDKPFSQTRHAAYCCLHSWLTVAGAASQLECVVDKLLPALLADVHAEKPSIRLQVGSKTGKGRKRQQVLVNQEDRSEKLGDPAANSRLCERALLTLVLVMRTCAPRLKPDIITSITNTVLRVVADLPVPYSDANCLTALYQLLLSLCLEPHPRLAPPLPPALAVFTAGTHHPDPTVRSTCMAALSSLDKVIHPTAATLFFPIAQDKQKRGKEIEDEEDRDSEKSISIPKRQKIDPDCDTESGVIAESIVDGNYQPSNVRKTGSSVCEYDMISPSQHPGKIVQPVLNKNTELIDIAEESSDEEIDVVDITEDDKLILGNSQRSEEESLKVNSETGIESKIPSHGLHEAQAGGCITKDEHCNIQSPLIESQSESKTDLKHDKEEENDADVSQMLMDFMDEVDDGTNN